jgi:dihydrodipicolinate synthase/N-acetylneuraminate lyase
MKTTPVRPEDLRGVFAVPPLARRPDARRAIDAAQNDRILRHMAAGGLRRFLYGGNAFLYHATLAEYEEMLGWLSGLPEDHWAIPSVGPSFGRAMDQAPLLRRHRFPAAMALPCSDPRDAAGLEAGLREFADAAGVGLILYLKEEGSFGTDRTAGLDAVARLVESKVCVGIKYAVVRPDAVDDPYLKALLERVDRHFVVSGMGERPAVAHLRAFDLPGFTTGSGCVAPSLCQALYEAAAAKDWARAEELRRAFMPLEDQRDAWGPARVLHAAVELAGIATTGAIPPFVSALSDEQRAALEPTARTLVSREREHATATAPAAESARR